MLTRFQGEPGSQGVTGPRGQTGEGHGGPKVRGSSMGSATVLAAPDKGCLLLHLIVTQNWKMDDFILGKM